MKHIALVYLILFLPTQLLAKDDRFAILTDNRLTKINLTNYPETNYDTNKTLKFSINLLHFLWEGKASDKLSYKFEYRAKNALVGHSDVNLAAVKYQLNKHFAIEAGRQSFLMGGIEANFYDLGDVYMYTLANLTLLTKFNDIYVDGVSLEYLNGPTKAVIIAGNTKGNDVTPTSLGTGSTTTNTNQKMPYYGAAFATSFFKGAVTPFLSYFHVPLEKQGTPSTNTVTSTGTAYNFHTAGFIFRLGGHVAIDLESQYYDYGQTSLTATEDDYSFGNAIQVTYLQEKYKIMAKYSHSDNYTADIKTQYRDGVSLSVNFMAPKPLITYIASSYTKDKYPTLNSETSALAMSLGIKGKIDILK